MAIFAAEELTILQIFVLSDQMQLLLMMIRMIVSLSVEMDSDIQVKNEMMAMKILTLMVALNPALLIMSTLVQEEQSQLQIPARIDHQSEELSQLTKEAEYLFEEMA